jgi:tyrosine-protein phosphatase 2/3
MVAFCRLCWQENVHVIVMLTREVESALVKCGNYWAEGTYGPLRLKLVSTSDTPERERKRRESEMSSGFFNIPQARAAQQNDKDEEQTIRRVFELTHTGYPDIPPRTVTQLQYLDWPDLDVPKDPRGLLELMQEVDDVVEKSGSHGGGAWGEGPLLQKAGSVPSIVSPDPAKFEQLSDFGSSGRETTPEGDDSDDLDEKTGVAKHAMDNPPVLLHCSAGVGRTGGFIAVDAVLDGVRREMRKRREEKEKMSSGTGSPVSSVPRSQSSVSRESTDEPMEVDARSSTSMSPRPDALQSAGNARHSMSVSVGVDREDLPPSGASRQQSEAMDVDSDVPSKQMPPPKQALQPSTDLINDMRRAHLRRMSASKTTMPPVQGHDFISADSSSPKIHSPSPHFASSGTVSETETTSGSLTSSGRGSTSTSALSNESRMGTSPASSSAAASMSSLNSILKVMTTNSPPHDNETYAPSISATAGSTADSKSTVEPLSPPKSETAPRDKQRPETSRFDSWRSGVDDSRRHHTTDANPNIEYIEQDKMPPTPQTLRFDYTAPRPLHVNESPPLLSSYDDPIQRVIEDMRQQRMSLCQSLRQYVFVHRAIIEGALMIVDEERKHEEDELAAAQKAIKSKDDVAMAVDFQIPPSTRSPSKHASFAPEPDMVKEQHMSASQQPVSHPAGAPDVHMSEQPGLLAPPGIPSPRSKRQASPTELVQTDLSGEARLMKRPSVKRKARSSDQEGISVRPHAMVLSSSPPPGE